METQFDYEDVEWEIKKMKENIKRLENITSEFINFILNNKFDEKKFRKNEWADNYID